MRCSFLFLRLFIPFRRHHIHLRTETRSAGIYAPDAACSNVFVAIRAFAYVVLVFEYVQVVEYARLTVEFMLVFEYLWLQRVLAVFGVCAAHVRPLACESSTVSIFGWARLILSMYSLPTTRGPP